MSRLVSRSGRPARSVSRGNVVLALAFWIAGAPSVEAAGVPYNVGDVIVSQPTPTPGGGVPSAVVPTLSFPMLGLLCAALMAAALLLMRR